MGTHLEKTLDGIIRIEAKIDLLVLTVNEKNATRHDLDFFEGIFGHRLFADRGSDGNYREKYIRNYPQCQVNLLMDPILRHSPPVMIEIFPRDNIPKEAYEAFLRWLNESVPGLEMMKVEYTIDQYCRSPEDVADLFEVEKDHLYFRHIKASKPYLLGGTPLTVGDIKTRTNFTFYFDQGRAMKIYERGSDAVRSGDGWLLTQVDRVRLEFTAEGKALAKRNIRTLDDFLKNPRFHFPIEFRRFKIGSPFPTGPFSESYYEVKRQGLNPSPYAEGVKELDSLRLALVNAMFEFMGRRFL